MIVKTICLDFFRNYVHLEAAFDPKVNVIYGENAQGKTNLLEAIAYLSAARSHRARYDKEMIQMGVDSAFLKGEISSRDRDFTLEAKLLRGRGRQRPPYLWVPRRVRSPLRPILSSPPFFFSIHPFFLFLSPASLV